MSRKILSVRLWLVLLLVAMLGIGLWLRVRSAQAHSRAETALSNHDLAGFDLALSKPWIDPNLRTIFEGTGRTFAHYLVIGEYFKDPKFFREAFTIFINHGGKINQQDVYGRTALHYAYSLRRPQKILDILYEKGASDSIVDKNGKIPKETPIKGT